VEKKAANNTQQQQQEKVASAMAKALNKINL
jgi:hypothetical protein